jgi:hypothetical protein
MTGRRIAIAYTSFAVGRGLIQWARDKLLSTADTIYICHVFHKNPVGGWCTGTDCHDAGLAYGKA